MKRSRLQTLVRPILNYCGYIHVDQGDYIARELTLVTSLYLSVKHSADRVGVISALVSYVQAHSQLSILGHARKMVANADRSSIEDAIKNLIGQSGETEQSWMEQLKFGMDNWDKIRNSKVVGNMLNLVNYAVSLGMCQASDITFSYKNLELFAPTVKKMQVRATDFIDLVLKTVIGFFQGGYRVYTNQSFMAFFNNEDDMYEFDQKYNEIIDLHSYAICGNLLEYKNKDDSVYEQLLDSAVTLGEKLEKLVKNKSPYERSYIETKMKTIRLYRSEFDQIRIRGGVRIAPFALSFYGDSAMGKTAVNELTIQAMGEYNNIDVSPDRCAVWADNDKFASNVRSSTNVITFDDFANTVEKKMDFSPCMRLIQCVNNALVPAPQAEVSLKGKVALHPYFVTITTNVKNLLANAYSNKPESIVRRFIHVTVKLKPEFQSKGKLDTDKVIARFGSMKKDVDIWNLTVEEVVVGDPACEGSSHKTWYWSVITYRNAPMTDVNLFTFLDWAREASKKHLDQQHVLVQTMRSKGMYYNCPTCKLYTCSCVEPTACTPHIEPIDVCQKCGNVFCSCDNIVSVRDDVSDDPLFQEIAADFSVIEALLGLPQTIRKKFSAQSGTRPIRYTFWFLYLFLMMLYAIFINMLIAFSPDTLLRFSRYLEFMLPHSVNTVIARVADRCYTMNTFAGIIAWRMRLEARYYYWSTYLFYNSRETYRNFHDFLSRLSTRQLIENYNFWDNEWFNILSFIPSSWIEHRHFTFLYFVFRPTSLLNTEAIIAVTMFFGLLCHVLAKSLGYNTALLLVLPTYLIWIRIFAVMEKRRIFAEIMRRRDAAPTMVKLLRENYSKVIIGSGCAFTIWMLVTKYYEGAKVFTSQGNLQPKDMSEIEERDGQKNPWLGVTLAPQPTSTESKTTLPSNLIRMCAENTYYAEIEGKFSRCFALRTNMVLFPKHFLNHFFLQERKELKVTFYKANVNQIGAKFYDKINFNYCWVPDTGDICLAYCPAVGSKKDLLPYLPTGIPRGTEANFILKEKDGTYKNYLIAIKQDMRITHHLMEDKETFVGFTYRLPFETREGMCMSPIVTSGRSTFIAGFHLGGMGIVGACGLFTQDQALHALMVVNAVPGVVFTAEMGDLPKRVYDKTVLTGEQTHYKSPTRFLTDYAHIELYGTMSERVTPKTSVKTSIISQSITRICGVPCKWGPPPLKGDGVYPFQAALEKYSKPSIGVGPELEWAVVSYRHNFARIYCDYNTAQIFRVSPLTERETLCGIDGKRFIDRMNMKTSPGWPLHGRKDKFFVRPADEPEDSVIVELSPIIRAEVERCRALLLCRKRPYFIWKACLKDEPTKLTKKKVRVFQSAPLSLSFLIRQYFLPLVRIMQLYPLDMECMVGVNAESTEWEQVFAYVESKGSNILAGDYSSYDLKMPAQLVNAAFHILIDVAKSYCNYSAKDITVMESLVIEVSNPLMAYNGDLIQLFGSNPSGNNLTVIVNSIVNSLLLRCAFNKIYPEVPPTEFKKYCAFATYGDDVVGSVDPSKPLYNHLSYRDYLATIDMGFTMPDKESEAVAYLAPGQVDFLKRKNYYHPDLKCHVGALALDSMWKRLHCHLESPFLSDREMACEAIDTTMHDCFINGPEVYNDMYEKLYQVAQEHELVENCKCFNPENSYDERVKKWNQQYRGEAPLLDTKDTCLL